MSTATPLSVRLKDETGAWHAQVERSGLMARLMRGQVDRCGYCALLRNLHAIYAALEDSLDRHARSADLAGLWQPALRRCAALEQDLEVLHPGVWARDFALTPAASAYAERLHDLALSAPGLLVAHAYLRYLGDLHGGQMLARVVRQSCGLAPGVSPGAGSGTAFYDFGDADQRERLRREFRSALDALPLTPAGADAMISEAIDAFARHQRLFDELALAYPGA